MSARDLESALLSRCATVAQHPAQHAQNQREANVFYLAAMVIQSRFPNESKQLMQVSQQYFTLHPNQKVAAVEVVRNGWVLSLPRLRDMLTKELHGF